MNPFDKFERAIGKVLSGGSAERREPIEIRRAVLREIADQVQPAGNGERIFPFTAVRVELSAADAASQGAMEAIFSLPGFAEDVIAAVKERHCLIRLLDVQVEVRLVDPAETPPAPYRIDYHRSANPSRRIALPRPAARLVVLAGRADPAELNIERDLVYIGRLRDVVSSTAGLDRRNQLAFDDSESTVSRKHARLEYEPDTGKFRLFNDPAQTSVSRDGRGIPCDATRGVQLKSGDEIILGKARVRFELL